MTSYSAAVSENKRFWEILVDLQVLERYEALGRVRFVWQCSGQFLHLAGNSGIIGFIRGVAVTVWVFSV